LEGNLTKLRAGLAKHRAREPYPGKKPLPKPEPFVDLSIVERLEKNGFRESNK